MPNIDLMNFCSAKCKDRMSDPEDKTYCDIDGCDRKSPICDGVIYPDEKLTYEQLRKASECFFKKLNYSFFNEL